MATRKTASAVKVPASSAKPAAKKAAAAKTLAVKSGLPASPKAEAPKFKTPKSLGAAADRCYALREERLGFTRQADGIKAEEGFLREYLIENLPKGDATGIVGKDVRATIKTDVVPQAEDWSKVYAHIVAEYNRHLKAKDGQQDAAFAILNKALNAAAVKDVWAAGKGIPGVGKFNTKSVSFNKV